jgi:serine/threonine protein kinase
VIGQTVSHYKILEKLGEGGMGVVYKAQDTKLLRPVALKFLTPEMTRDQDAKKRFIQEALAASALDHPNIAVVHEVDETADGNSFICMAYYDGQTLKARLAKGPFEIDEAVQLILQIASGLQRAHESNIVHRDIKPGNIIITCNGEVKIVDFGLAKLSAQTRESRIVITGRTAAYVAPEQIMGSEADRRSDLFSLGVVFFESVAGRRPFAGEHEAAFFYSITNAEPPVPSAIRPEIPQELDRIILRLLEKDPAKRYQCAADLRDDLKHFLG